MARRLLPDGSEELVPGTRLLPGDRVVVEPNEIIPGDGEVVEGVASVDESAITGESAPVIRESGGDRSAVTGGTKVLSDRIVVQITSKPGETFIDRMIALVEGAQATEDAERDRPQHPAREPDDHLLAGDGHAAAARDLLGGPAVDRGAGRAPRLPDPDHDRGAVVGDRHRRDGSAGAAERPRDVRAGGRGGRRRQHAPARQDRDDHPREPPGRRVHPRSRGDGGGAGRRGPAHEPGRRDARGAFDRGLGEGAVRACAAATWSVRSSWRSRRRPG